MMSVPLLENPDLAWVSVACFHYLWTLSLLIGGPREEPCFVEIINETVWGPKATWGGKDLCHPPLPCHSLSLRDVRAEPQIVQGLEEELMQRPRRRC